MHQLREFVDPVCHAIKAEAALILISNITGNPLKFSTCQLRIALRLMRSSWYMTVGRARLIDPNIRDPCASSKMTTLQIHLKCDEKMNRNSVPSVPYHDTEKSRNSETFVPDQCETIVLPFCVLGELSESALAQAAESDRDPPRLLDNNMDLPVDVPQARRFKKRGCRAGKARKAAAYLSGLQD